MENDYNKFLESKQKMHIESGFEIPEDELNKNLFPFQKFEGDTIFTPFMGIGSEVYQAVKMNRKGMGFELKESYYDIAKKNLEYAILEKNQLKMAV